MKSLEQLSLAGSRNSRSLKSLALVSGCLRSERSLVFRFSMRERKSRACHT